MHTIGVLYNPLAPATAQAGERIAAWLGERGLSVWLGTSQSARDEPEKVAPCQLMLALGGDGTVLRAARIGITHNMPILGVAMGHLSFMAEVTEESVYAGLEVLLNGGGWYDQRTLVRARVLRQGQEIFNDLALNEVLLSRRDVARVVHVSVAIDDMPLTSYRADGVLVSTATGSTAYALAAGGPVLDPRSDSLLLVTVAGHLTSLPALVLPPDTKISWTLARHHPTIISLDGQWSFPIEPDDLIEVTRAQEICRFAHVYPQAHFYQSLTQRLRRQ